MICKSLDDEHHAFVLDCDTSKAIWDKLAAIHSTGTGWSVDQLFKKYNQLKFMPGQRVNACVAELTVIMQRLATAGEKISDKLALSKVLSELQQEYNTLQQS